MLTEIAVGLGGLLAIGAAMRRPADAGETMYADQRPLTPEEKEALRRELFATINQAEQEGLAACKRRSRKGQERRCKRRVERRAQRARDRAVRAALRAYRRDLGGGLAAFLDKSGIVKDLAALRSGNG